jgi:uncharacterized repeat protein (TIGR03806 family)
MFIFNRLRRSDPGVAVLLLALGGCGGSSGGPPPDEGAVPGAPAVVGLDERPVNSTCLAPPRPSTAFGIEVARAFPALSFEQPLFMLQAPGDDSRWFVLEKTGRVRAFDNQAGVAAASVVLDLSTVVNTASEGGLLGMAFARDFATDHIAYVSYTRTPPGSATGMQSVVSRFRSGDGGLTLDPATEQVLLTVHQPFGNHNGGGIEFGPDGYLYIGMGDGGSGGDPQDNAQNTHNLLGTVLRIDVSGGGDYGIPPDNPFAGNPRCGTSASAGTSVAPCPEIYAWGLRNPWRFSFDRVAGRLWAGDVGQNAREEINVIALGGNYGWRHREGFTCFEPPVDCPSAGLVDPVLDYPHSDGRSVTGGYVYRGTASAALQGRYVFGDFVSGRIWVLDADEHGTYGKIEIADTSLSISSFGEANDGTLYVVDFGGGLYRLQAADAAPVETIPDELTQTGCVDAADPATPATGLIPFRPNAPHWSDGAVSERWLALPEAASIAVANGGELSFPPGAVLMQHLRRQGQLVETRLLLHHADGAWAGYTYAWNTAQSEARRVVGGAVEPIGGEPWLYPSEAECMQCHTAAAGRTLGLELAQLNGELLYSATGRTANQLRTLDAIGLFAPPLAADPADLPALPGPFGDASLDQRARAYLHTNCAGCHRPGGPTPSDIDLRYDTPLAEIGACDVAGTTSSDLGIPDVRLLVPGDAGRSLLWLRMDRRDVHAMPPAGTLEIDAEGVALVGAWIAALGGCS